jgi:ribosomal protein S18 acetylase RimI-like enzyme
MPGTPADPTIPSAGEARSVRIVRLEGDLLTHGARRLVAHQAGAGEDAGERFLDNAGAAGINLSLFWGSVDERSGHVREVCLAVVAPGRTASVFVSVFPAERDPSFISGETRQARLLERAGVVRHVCDHLGRPSVQTGQGVRLVQALLETSEIEPRSTLTSAGFMELGELAYLRAPMPRSARRAPQPVMPAGVTVKPAADLPPSQRDQALVRALELSYQGTLDCPELSGLRTPSEVLESHRSVGDYDPSFWWIAYDGSEPAGCLLLTPCPEFESLELVYLGLGPTLRGRGAASALLARGVAHVVERRVRGLRSVTCAVDTRNAPALRLYARHGFERTGVRLPLVKGLGPARAPHASG